MTAYDDIVTDPAVFFKDLKIDTRALTLSTAAGYNTWQLTATPRNALDEPILGLPASTFRLEFASDTTKLRVTPDGQLTARSAGANIRVIAELVAPGNLRRLDTATVTVTTLATPPVLDSISIAPIAPDSAMWPLARPGVLNGVSIFWSEQTPHGGIPPFLPPTPAAPLLVRLTLKPQAWDVTGTPVTDLPYEYVSLDPDTAFASVTMSFNVPTVTITTLRPGRARFVVRTTAYGVTKVDTAVFTITPPVSADVVHRVALNGAIGFEPSEVRIRTNGVVFWSNMMSGPADIVFDDPTHVGQAADVICDFSEMDFVTSAPRLRTWPPCAAGNFTLPALPEGGGVLPLLSTAVFRQFPVAGVYPYRNVQTGATGRVVVQAVPGAP